MQTICFLLLILESISNNGVDRIMHNDYLDSKLE